MTYRGINAVEAAKPRVEFDLVLRLFDRLGLRLDLVQPGLRDDVWTDGSVDLDAILDQYSNQ